jgi:flagellar hook-length control protein FliK
LSTAAILPGFTLPAAAAPQPATAAFSAAAFGDLLSAFTGNSQQNGQDYEGDHAAVPESAPNEDGLLVLSLPGLAPPGGWPATATAAQPHVQQQQPLSLAELDIAPRPAPPVPTTASLISPPAAAVPPSEEEASSLELPAPTAVPTVRGEWADQNAQTQSYPAPRPETAAAANTEASTPVPSALPLTTSAVAPTTPAPAPLAVAPAAGPVQSAAVVVATAGDAISNPAAINAARTQATDIQAGPLRRPVTPAIPAPAAHAPAAHPRALQPAQDPTLPAVPIATGSEPAAPSAQEAIVRIPDALPAQVQPAAAEAQKTFTASTASAQASAAPQPMAAQLARPLFTLATETPGEHVMTMKVSPEDLGPVTVRAHISSEGVRLEMFAAGEAGRDAVRAALPELRRELALQGLTASLDLSSRSSPDQGQPQSQHRGTPDQGGPYRQNLRMVTDAEPTPGQPARTPASTAALDVVA